MTNLNNTGNSQIFNAVEKKINNFKNKANSNANNMAKNINTSNITNDKNQENNNVNNWCKLKDSGDDQAENSRKKEKSIENEKEVEEGEEEKKIKDPEYKVAFVSREKINRTPPK